MKRSRSRPRTPDVAVQLSHHKAAGKENWGKVHRSLDAIARRARARRHGRFADAYPLRRNVDRPRYDPPGRRTARRSRCDARTFARSRDRRRTRICACNSSARTSAHDIQISTVASERNAPLAGMRLGRHRMPRGASRRHARHCDCCSKNASPCKRSSLRCRRTDVASVLSAGFVSIGSDASARSDRGPTAQGVPHPRTFGTFPPHLRVATCADACHTLELA